MKKPKKEVHKKEIRKKFTHYNIYNKLLKKSDKQEQEIAELTADMLTLIEDKDLAKTITVKMKWLVRLSIQKAVWQGDATKLTKVIKHHNEQSRMIK